MTSEPGRRPAPAEAYVWIWLPGATRPVPAGRIAREGDRLIFNYGRSYLARPDAMAIYEPELPLRRGAIRPIPGLAMAGCLRDAAPDAWGRRVILHRAAGGRGADVGVLDELVCLLDSGSDRTGALDFQLSATDYVPRESPGTTLGELLDAAGRVEAGIPLTPGLDRALLHGTSIGGARPKAAVTDCDRKFIAKFSLSGDVINVVKAEFVAMRLAAEAGLDAAPVRLERAGGRDVLLVRRFDRKRSPGGWQRRSMVSALTLLGLDEMLARYASYAELAEIIRHRFADPRRTLRELFGRLVFNVLCGNTDDHARNHAAFWDGQRMTLTPAYDICPQARTGNEAGQAMLIDGADRSSRLATCIAAAPNFLLDAGAAGRLIAAQLDAIRRAWPKVCAEASLGAGDRRLLAGRMFFNPFVFEGAPAPLRLPPPLPVD